ncbi:TPA: hypothetical protein TY768_000693 [Streptococcus suis]|nr:hypothetical protein [Streptococcus suis]
MFTEESLQDIFEIADILSEGDEIVYRQLKEIVFAQDPEALLDHLETLIAPEFFQDLLEKFTDSEKNNLWCILIYLLIQRNYIVVTGQTEFLSSFIQGFDKVPFMQRSGITLWSKLFQLDTRDSQLKWISNINHILLLQDAVVGAVYLNDEKNYFFLSKLNQMQKLSYLAERLGFSIQIAG